MNSTAYLDHYQTEQLGLYWRHYPEIGLHSGTFYNLLLHDELLLDPESLYPEEIPKHPWADAFERFLALEKVRLKDRNDLSHSAWRIFRSPELQSLNVPDFEDVFNYDFSIRNGVPFSLSERRSQDILKIAALARKALDTPCVGAEAEEAPGHREAVAQWLVELRIPALEVRNEKMRRKLLLERPHLVARSSTGEIDKGFTEMLVASTWWTLQQTVFVSPQELFQIFGAREKIAAVRSALQNLADRVATRSELADGIRMQEDTLERRLGGSDFFMAGLGLGLCWVPFSSLGTVPLEVGINYRIRKSFNWLLFLNTVNKTIRGQDAESS